MSSEYVPTSQTNAFAFGQTQQCYRMVWCNWANTFLHARLFETKEMLWFEMNLEKMICKYLTLHEFGGTNSCVISPAWTQNRCNNAPLYRSHKQTAKSTPPESRCDLSYLKRKLQWKFWNGNSKYFIKCIYLGCANDGHNKQLTLPRCPERIWWGGHSEKTKIN